MNFISKIIEQVIISLNNRINNLNEQTVETIKRGFFSIVAVLVIIGIFVGYYSGKDAAHNKSTSIAEYTNDVFEVDVKRQREDGNFRSMLETEMLGKRKGQELGKKRFPVNEKFKIETNSNIFEPDISLPKASPFPLPDSRDKIAEVDRIDIKNTGIEVNELNRRSGVDKNKADHRLILQEKDNLKVKEKKYSTDKKKLKKNNIILEPIKKEKILIER